MIENGDPGAVLNRLTVTRLLNEVDTDIAELTGSTPRD